MMNRLLFFIEKNPFRLLSIGMAAYIFVFTAISFWKYDHFLYNALDLAIYTQVFESFRTGNFWYSSIQQSSYLGDHFEPFILALLPFYLLFSSPKTLLVLQTVFLALPAIPIFLIARIVFQAKTPSAPRNAEDAENDLSALCVLQRAPRNLWPLGISFFYLLNPLVHNINLFEFHLLPFFLFFIFLALFFYIQNTKKSFFFFVLFCFLALLTREDISLIVFMFGVLAFIERRRWFWIIIPMTLGAWWFLLSMGIISAFNTDGSYKFLTYYSWIFQASPLQFVVNILGQIDNWVMVFSFLFTFLLVPLLKARFLILALPPFLQFALVDGGSGGIVWTTHYAAYFLPALFLSSMYGMRRLIGLLYAGYFKNKYFGFVFEDRGLMIAVLTLATIGLIIIFGPLGNFVPYIGADHKRLVTNEEKRAQRALVNMIPSKSDATLSSSYLPMRWANNDSALFWVFKGFKQFSSAPYIPTRSIDYALFDSKDLLGFIFSLKEYENGDNRVRNFINERDFFVQNYTDRFILFSKKPTTEESLYKTWDSLPENPEIKLNDQTIDREMNIKLAAFGPPEISRISVGATDEFLIASFPLFWEKIKNTDKIYVMNILIRNSRGKIAVNKNYPMGYGLYPASDWETGKIIQTNHRILLPSGVSGEYEIYLGLVDATQGGFVIDQVRSATVLIPDKRMGEAIFLGKFLIPN